MPLPEQLLSRLSEHVAEQMGLYFPQDRWRDLESGIEAAARELGLADAVAYGRDLLAAKLSKEQIEVLAGALTIGETYFFRDTRSLDLLADEVFPEMIRARRAADRRLRIWSAGCCTGEEAYSLAILLDRLLPDLERWQVMLLATDINSRFLRKAAEGIYGEWSFRGAPPWLKERYFRPVAARRFALAPRIKSLVTFAYLNLGEDVYPSLDNNTNAMDLILCRNVLMYFSEERVAQVVHNFHRALVGTGWFLVSAVETSSQFNKYFVPAPFDGATLYRKRIESAPVQAPTPAVILPRWDAAPSTSDDAGSQPERPAPPPQSVHAAALALYERGRYAEAAELLKDAAAAPESDIDDATLLARIHANLGDLGTARWWAERAVAADRTNALSHYLCAIILQEQAQFEAAAIELQKTLYLEPAFVLAHFALGNLTHGQGKPAAAARHFANALDLLRRYDDNDVLPHSEGMVAGRLKQTIESMLPVAGTA